MRMVELRGRAPRELHEELRSLVRERFRLRSQLLGRRLRRVDLLRKVRRDVARIRTVLGSSGRGG